MQEEKATAIRNVKAVSMAYTSPHKPFASHFRQNENNSTIQKPPIVTDFLKLADYFLEPEQMSLEQEISIFLKDFKNMEKSKARVEFLRILKKVKQQYDP